jgi:uncharacterized damage-inducible protein DinB
MDISELQMLYAYNRWANDRILRALEPLTDEQLGRDLGGSFGSLAATLVHLVGAEWVWMERFRGRSPQRFEDASRYHSVAAVRTRLSEIEQDYIAYLVTLTPADLDRHVAYTNFSGQSFSNPLGWLLRHVVNHASYHRGQITFMLRQLGVPVVSTDLIVFVREQALV